MLERFTYEWYSFLLDHLVDNGYGFTDYTNEKQKKTVILRHDIDTSIDAALKMSELEAQKSAYSTYFVLLTSDFYNPNSRKSIQALRKIIENGCKIGLHFDEVRYNNVNEEKMIAMVLKEKKMLEMIIEAPVETVSMHRPSPWVLKSDLQVSGMVNSYSKHFFEEYKYVSDSRMNWRENVEEIIHSGVYTHLHILTHSFWYQDKYTEMKDILQNFIEHANKERYMSMKENITNFESIFHNQEE